MGEGFGKGGGLGVLDGFGKIQSGLRGIRNSLHIRDRDRGIKDALEHVKNVQKVARKTERDSKRLQKETKRLVRRLTNVFLPLFKQKKKETKGGKSTR